MFPTDDPLGLGLMQRANRRRWNWDLSHQPPVMPGEMEETSPMGVAPHMASTDMLPQYLNEQQDSAESQGMRYRTMPFTGNNQQAGLSGLRSATKRKK